VASSSLRRPSRACLGSPARASVADPVFARLCTGTSAMSLCWSTPRWPKSREWCVRRRRRRRLRRSPRAGAHRRLQGPVRCIQVSHRKSEDPKHKILVRTAASLPRPVGQRPPPSRLRRRSLCAGNRRTGRALNAMAMQCARIRLGDAMTNGSGRDGLGYVAGRKLTSDILYMFCTLTGARESTPRHTRGHTEPYRQRGCALPRLSLCSWGMLLQQLSAGNLSHAGRVANGAAASHNGKDRRNTRAAAPAIAVLGAADATVRRRAAAGTLRIQPRFRARLAPEDVPVPDETVR
jgi:hypothetical protein